jgi:glutathionylspermidine synthase
MEEDNVRTEMVQLARLIRDAGDELHDLCVELADNIARTDPDDTYLDFIIAELEKSDDSTDVTAHLVASGVRAMLMFDAIDESTAAMH